MIYRLTVKPAIDAEERRKLEDKLKEMGYQVWGSDAVFDKKECHVSFSKERVKKLEKFKEIYNEELNRFNDEKSLAWEILNLTNVRAFVYEICKNCLEHENRDLMIRIDSLLSCLKHRHASTLEKIGEYQEVSELNDLVQNITRKK